MCALDKDKNCALNWKPSRKQIGVRTVYLVITSKF